MTNMRKLSFIILFMITAMIPSFAIAEDLNETNLTENIPQNLTINEVIVDFTITNFIPKEFKIGDVQFNIQVENIGNTEIKNLMAIVSGDGFSTYDMTPIDLLRSGEKSYIIVLGNLKKEGTITLNIRINEKIFYKDITVINPASVNYTKLKEEEEKKKAILDTFSVQFDELKNNYDLLEKELETKRNSNYDVSGVNLNDLKNLIRDVQSSLILENVGQTNASITLALEEYYYEKQELDNAILMKKTIMMIAKENAIVISTLAGALVTLFTLYEILKKKKEGLHQTLNVLKEKSAHKKKKK